MQVASREKVYIQGARLEIGSIGPGAFPDHDWISEIEVSRLGF